MAHSIRILVLILSLLSLFLVSCQGQDVEEPAPTPVSTAESEPAPTVAIVIPDLEAPGEETPEPIIEEQKEPGGNADVLFVSARLVEDNNWTFAVTVEHPDTGWEDYADGWDVVLPDGSIVKPDPESPFTRLLLHPHENEQPFTRSQRGIVIPPEVTNVVVRAHDIVDGFGGQEVVVDLTASGGNGFEIER